MFEAILFSGALTTPQQQSIEGYLAQKWGLTVNLPPGHPGLTQTLYNGRVYQPRIALQNAPYANYYPLSIAGCAFWFDAADTSSIQISSGTTISTWINKAGNGFPNLTTGANTVYTNGTAINGLNTVYVPASASLVTTTFTVPSAYTTVFYVVKGLTALAGANRGYFIWIGNSTNFNNFAVYNVTGAFGNALLYENRAAGAYFAYTVPTETFYNNASIGTTVGNYSTPGGYLNGSNISTYTLSGSPFGQTGSTTYSLGENRPDTSAYVIGELIVYYGNLTNN